MQSCSYLEQTYPEVASHVLRLSVFGIVRKAREQRMTLVQEQSQYAFIYWFLQKWVLDHIFTALPSLL